MLSLILVMMMVVVDMENCDPRDEETEREGVGRTREGEGGREGGREVVST